LELTGCDKLTEYMIDNMFKNFPNLQFVDLNHIPAVTPAFYEVLKASRPDLLGRRFKFTEVDIKDNMQRVPWKVAEKSKAKGKGKKKKKK